MSWILDRSGSRPNRWYRYQSTSRDYELLLIAQCSREGELVSLVATLLSCDGNLRKALARTSRELGNTSLRRCLIHLKDWATAEQRSPMTWLSELADPSSSV